MEEICVLHAIGSQLKTYKGYIVSKCKEYIVVKYGVEEDTFTFESDGKYVLKGFGKYVLYKCKSENIKKSKKKYRENNKEKIKEASKEYYENNKEKIKQARKEWRNENRDKVDEYQEKYNKKRKEKIECECGRIVSKNNFQTHLKTNIHFKRLAKK